MRFGALLLVSTVWGGCNSGSTVATRDRQDAAPIDVLDARTADVRDDEPARDAGYARPPVQSGAGIAVYWNADVRLLTATESETLFVAATVGHPTVEVLAVSLGQVSSRTLSSPDGMGDCSERQPIALVAADVDLNGSLDVLVEDTCGSYVVLDAGTSRERTTELPVTFHQNGTQLYVDTSASAGGALLLRATEGSIEILAGTRGQSWSEVMFGDGILLPRIFTNMALFHIAGFDVIVQGREELRGLRSGSNTLGWTGIAQRSIEPPNLRPYLIYDSLVGIPGKSCAAGVGRFDPRSGNTPRHLNLLDFEHAPDSRTYKVTEHLPTIDVLAVGATSQDGTSRSLLGLLSAEQGAVHFRVYEVTSCKQLREVANTTLDGTIRTHVGSGEIGLMTNSGLKIVPFSMAGAVSFFLYDGAIARVFSLKREGDGERLTEHKSSLHNQ